MELALDARFISGHENAMSDEPAFDINIEKARREIGELWGLSRPITKEEMARALRLSPKHGGSHISKLEKGTATMTGPIAGFLEALLDGYTPRHMKDVIKPGYPRGAVR
jgi:hypothetical protein